MQVEEPGFFPPLLPASGAAASPFASACVHFVLPSAKNFEWHFNSFAFFLPIDVGSSCHCCCCCCLVAAAIFIAVNCGGNGGLLVCVLQTTFFNPIHLQCCPCRFLHIFVTQYRIYVCVSVCGHLGSNYPNYPMLCVSSSFALAPCSLGLLVRKLESCGYNTLRICWDIVNSSICA